MLGCKEPAADEFYQKMGRMGRSAHNLLPSQDTWALACLRRLRAHK